MLLIGKMLLQLIRLVLVIGLLRADIEAAAHQRVRIDVMHDVAIDPLDKLMRRQAVQHDLSVWSIRGSNDKPGGSEIILALRHNLLLCLTCRQ